MVQKKFFIMLLFTGNEWITSLVLLKFLEELCFAYSTNSNIFENKATDLFNSVTLFIAPMLNPDGVDLVTDSIDKNSSAYLNALSISNSFPDIPFPNGWKANIVRN